MARDLTPNDGTIAGYWLSHGYSRDEALQIEREQIAAAMAVQDEDDNHEQWFNCY